LKRFVAVIQKHILSTITAEVSGDYKPTF